MKPRSIKTRLIARKAELLGEIAARSDAVHEVSIDEREDKIVEHLNDEVLSALSDSDRAEVLRIEAALKKIAEGTYGICDNCEQNIAAARLEAMPDAVLCIDCASKSEA